MHREGEGGLQPYFSIRQHYGLAFVRHSGDGNFRIEVCAKSQLLPISIDRLRRAIHTLRIVKNCTGFLLILASVIAAGCGGSPGSFSANSPVLPDVTGNWQIQSSVVSQAVPPNAVLLLGALKSSASQVTGTFRFTNLGQPAICGLEQVVTLSGSLDSKNNLTLTSAALPNGTTIKIALAISGSGPYSGQGTVEVDGPVCTFAPASALGLEVANVSGSFAGTLTPGLPGSPVAGTSGAVSLALTQSSNPTSDGQFATTSSLTYQFGSCAGSASLSGDTSGIGVMLSAVTTAPPTLQTVNLIGIADSAATKITTSLLISPAPCSTNPLSNASYFGVLARQ